MKEVARHSISIAISHLRLAAASLDVACLSEQAAADLINKIQGQDDLGLIADRLEALIKEPVP